MQRVIGLDLGTYSIKAVEIVNTFKSYEIVNFYENVVPELSGLSKDAIIPHCLEQLFIENNIKADRIVTAMPGQYISSRIMTFSFSDPRKIEAAVASELEDFVPFDLDEMIVDQQILGTIDGQTVVLAVMTKKEYVRKFLENLARINIDPKLIDIDCLAFYNLSAAMPIPTEKCVGLIDLGHEKSSICIVENGVLRMFRSVNLGGRFITDFIARDLEVSFTEAQRLKHRVSKIFCEEESRDGYSGDELIVAERITAATNAIVKELGRTLYAFKTYEKSPVEHMFLSGGSARIVGINDFLSEQLSANVYMNRLEDSSLILNPNLKSNCLEMPQSVAIGMRAISGIKRVSQVNLRKGEFAYIQDYEKVLRGALTFSKFISVAIMILFVSYGLHFFFYKKQTKKLHTLYNKEIVKIFPDLKSKVKPSTSFKKARSTADKKFLAEIEKRQMSVQNFIDTNQGSPGLVALAQISKMIKAELTLDTTLYQYTVPKGGGGKLVFKAEVDDFTAGTELLETIKRVPVLMNVSEKSSNQKPGSKKIDYVIHAELNQQYDLSSTL